MEFFGLELFWDFYLLLFTQNLKFLECNICQRFFAYEAGSLCFWGIIHVFDEGSNRTVGSLRQWEELVSDSGHFNLLHDFNFFIVSLFNIVYYSIPMVVELPWWIGNDFYVFLIIIFSLSSHGRLPNLWQIEGNVAYLDSFTPSVDVWLDRIQG